MADNIVINEGTETTMATRDVSGVHHQRAIIEYYDGGVAYEAGATQPLPVSAAIPTTFYHGQKDVTTAGTEVVLASSQALESGVTVKALAANTGLIFVGGNPVTSATGFQLAAGEQIFIETDNLADVYVDSAQDGEGVCYIGS